MFYRYKLEKEHYMNRPADMWSQSHHQLFLFQVRNCTWFLFQEQRLL